MDERRAGQGRRSRDRSGPQAACGAQPQASTERARTARTHPLRRPTIKQARAWGAAATGRRSPCRLCNPKTDPTRDNDPANSESDGLNGRICRFWSCTTWRKNFSSCATWRACSGLVRPACPRPKEFATMPRNGLPCFFELAGQRLGSPGTRGGPPPLRGWGPPGFSVTTEGSQGRGFGRLMADCHRPAWDNCGTTRQVKAQHFGSTQVNLGQLWDSEHHKPP